MRNIALDLGSKGIAVSEVRDGNVMGRWKVDDLNGLEKILGVNTPAARVAFEACREAWHVHDWVKARGHEPVVADTARASASESAPRPANDAAKPAASKLHCVFICIGRS